ncbi:tumor necrosis factor ligand superfamily member 14-like [Lepisosteus oculatus]|uniref:tumor necrosis factor ligand superfamily member 14-like n=1 Tax=Lepisosteus oculatus TaxID=7918 RepID=UPI0035F51568
MDDATAATNYIKSFQAERNQKKPEPYLTGFNYNVSKDGKMFWESTTGNAFTYEMNYKDGSLVKGFYFIFSKICFSQLHYRTTDKATFKHGIYKLTQTYPADLELMSSESYHCRNDREEMFDNSFLGGIYYLTEGDQIFGKVNECKLIQMQYSSQNFFGVFLI